MESKGAAKMVMLSVAVLLMAGYVVFIAVNMARTDRAQERLLHMALALAAGVVAGAVGLAIGRKR